ncbi:MAG: ATP phosphoribosyltransferase regulatory subunit [Defluviicoccus sp.]|nr:ATP phosphoribosyltransferase regulatory subunit [Defluviicoccus sp.]
MNDGDRRALLPSGLRDVLPPAAAQESGAVERLIGLFELNGYERVKAPLVEFEEGLLSGAGAATASETFRLMDPASQRMMGVRADITPQVARIAASRLKDAPRPLRLCYSGDVLRINGTHLRPERQFTQVGMELIGSDEPGADAEIVVLAAEALTLVGAVGITVDLTMPPLAPAVCAAHGRDLAGDSALREAIDHKDAAAIAALGGGLADTLGALLAAAGPAERCQAALDALDLPPGPAAVRRRLAAVISEIRAAAPALRLAADPLENRGFEYHDGICFTVFPDGVRGELASGGRYVTGANGNGEGGELGTGVTLYVDTILRSVPAPGPPRRVFLPAGTAPETGRALRAEGWITVAGLGAAGAPEQEAARLGCTHHCRAGRVLPVG